MSQSSTSAISSRVSSWGWEELVHHLLTVVGSLPRVSASHLPVLCFSMRTILIRFISLFIWRAVSLWDAERGSARLAVRIWFLRSFRSER